MRTETGFELQAKFNMPADESPGLENGHVIDVYLEGHDAPIKATVTKIVALDGGMRQITFCTPAVIRIEPPAI